MLVTKRLDLPLLSKELTAAGVPHNGLGASGATEADPLTQDLHTYAADGTVEELPPEAVPVVEAHDASLPQRTAAFAAAEDDERLRLVNERARVDPAFAALADLALGKDR